MKSKFHILNVLSLSLQTFQSPKIIKFANRRFEMRPEILMLSNLKNGKEILKITKY